MAGGEERDACIRKRGSVTQAASSLCVVLCCKRQEKTGVGYKTRVESDFPFPVMGCMDIEFSTAKKMAISGREREGDTGNGCKMMGPQTQRNNPFSAKIPERRFTP